MTEKRPYSPRTINSAIKHGWYSLHIPKQEDLSYIGIMNTVDRLISGRYKQSYDLQGGGSFAFENTEDFTIIKLRFG